MKKLMIAAAVAMLGIAANAAIAQWSVSGLYIPVAKDVKVSETGIIPTSGSKFVANALELSLYYLDASGNEKFITSAKTTGDGVKGVAQFWTQAQALEIRDGKGEDDPGVGRYIDFIVKAEYKTDDGVYNFVGALNDKDFGSIENQKVTVAVNASTMGSWSYTANAIPEPTSGLLLLLGVAGLALRRRRA